MLKVSVEVDGVRRQLPLSHAQCTSMVEAFTNYHLHFRTEQIYDTLVCYPNDAHNLTFAVLEDVRVCPERRYRPRRLERAQVSWKPVANKTDKANKGVDSSEHKDQQAAEDKGRRTHDFLAFGLFLPEHPYSSELTAVLTAIGPMFPALAIVCGNGYEFRDMVQKYFVHSFPTLLLFKEGVYVGDYEGDHSPAALAAHFSLWTGQLPQTHPLVVPAPAALPSTALLPIRYVLQLTVPTASLPLSLHATTY